MESLKNEIILPEPEKNSEPSWFGFPITIINNKKFSRNDLINFLNVNKIATRLLFSGNLTKQPYMKDLLFRVSGELKNTDFIMENTFWIGLYPGLSLKHLDYVINKFKSYFKKK